MLSSIKNWLKPCLIYPVKGVSSLEDAFSFALTGIILFLMFFVGAEIVSRKFFVPIWGHYELVEVLIPVLAFIGCAGCQNVHGHLRVDFFIFKFKGRVYHFVESLWLVLSICLFLILAIFTFEDALFALEVGHVTSSCEFPTWPSRLCISTGCALMCCRLIIQLTQNLIQLAKGIERKDLNQSRMVG